MLTVYITASCYGFAGAIMLHDPAKSILKLFPKTLSCSKAVELTKKSVFFAFGGK